MNYKDLTSEQVIRCIKLHILTGQELDILYKSIYENLNELFNNLVIYKKNHLEMYTNLNNDIYIIHYPNENTIEIDEDNVWSKVFEHTNCSLSCMTGLFQWYLKEFLGIEGDVTYNFTSRTNIEVDETFKKIGTVEL